MKELQMQKCAINANFVTKEHGTCARTNNATMRDDNKGATPFKGYEGMNEKRNRDKQIVTEWRRSKMT